MKPRKCMAVIIFIKQSRVVKVKMGQDLLFFAILFLLIFFSFLVVF